MPDPRIVVGAVLGVSLIAAAPMAQARHDRHAHPLHFRHAKVEALKYSDLAGWRKDDLSAAFAAYMKSCAAILQGSKAMRKARPIYGGLYNACQKATALAASGEVDTPRARKFFEDNFKPLLRKRDPRFARQDQGIRRPALSRSGQICRQAQSGVHPLRPQGHR